MNSVLKIEADLLHLFISPGHNFTGHHGKPPSEHPIEAVDSIECVAGRGVRGDRFFGHDDDFKGQISFFAIEVYERLVSELGDPGCAASVFRRNVVTRGVDLNELIGVEFEVQGVRFQGAEECSPCYWMDRAFGAGAKAAMRDNGGLRARVLSDGTLRRSGA